MVILLGRRRGFDLRNEMGQVVVATLRQMDFIADPVELAFVPIAHSGVVG